MPYIKQTSRPELDTIVNELVSKIDPDNWQGDLNYCVTKVTLGLLNKKVKMNYSSLNSAVGVFECVKQEFYRRCVAGYEDSKIAENGDVY